ncbi:MAG: hypothetical protein V2I40_07745 [Desulfobacteraceae bacterium]|nr:hypothetical protein [Desulfobacteraceae bacterium]
MNTIDDPLHPMKGNTMVGFEILVDVHRDKRQEFLQTCELLGYPWNNQNPTAPQSPIRMTRFSIDQ